MVLIFSRIARHLSDMDLTIIPECFVDTNLIETLVPPKRGYNHQKGCGTVTKVMKEVFSDGFAVGIIDKDKKEVDYLKEFEIIVQKDSLCLHRHKTRHHYIIQINPAMEVFLLTQAHKNGVSLEDHRLPTDLSRLRKITKTVNSKDDTRIKGLIKAIKKTGSSEFDILEAWVFYLKENNYKVDLEILKGL